MTPSSGSFKKQYWLRTRLTHDVHFYELIWIPWHWATNTEQNLRSPLPGNSPGEISIPAQHHVCVLQLNPKKRKKKKSCGEKTSQTNNKKNHCCQRSGWWEGGEFAFVTFTLARLEEGAVWIACHRLSFNIRQMEFFWKLRLVQKEIIIKLPRKTTCSYYRFLFDGQYNWFGFFLYDICIYTQRLFFNWHSSWQMEM